MLRMVPASTRASNSLDHLARRSCSLPRELNHKVIDWSYLVDGDIGHRGLLLVPFAKPINFTSSDRGRIACGCTWYRHSYSPRQSPASRGVLSSCAPVSWALHAYVRPWCGYMVLIRRARCRAPGTDPTSCRTRENVSSNDAAETVPARSRRDATPSRSRPSGRAKVTAQATRPGGCPGYAPQAAIRFTEPPIPGFHPLWFKHGVISTVRGSGCSRAARRGRSASRRGEAGRLRPGRPRLGQLVRRTSMPLRSTWSPTRRDALAGRPSPPTSSAVATWSVTRRGGHLPALRGWTPRRKHRASTLQGCRPGRCWRRSTNSGRGATRERDPEDQDPADQPQPTHQGQAFASDSAARRGRRWLGSRSRRSEGLR